MKWEFFQGPECKEKISDPDERWTQALEAALHSRATPRQSGYHVHTGGVTQSGEVVFGANHEIGITSTSAHGEEDMINHAVNIYGEEDPVEIIAFAGLGGGEIIPPHCGNCRDVINEYTSINQLTVINGPKEGGRAIVMPGSTYFNDTFPEVTNDTLIQEINNSEGLDEAVAAVKRSYDIQATDKTPTRYGAAIVMGDDTFSGSFLGDTAYHSIYPLAAAIIHYRESKRRCKENSLIKEIYITAPEDNFKVMYRDRQHILEFTQGSQLFNNQQQSNVPIFLISTDSRDEITQIRKTNTDEWLPYPFSPANLGLESELARGFGKIFFR